MWVFTTDGFISATRWQRKDEYEGMICVRARELDALERIRELAPGATDIVVSEDGDYRYRVWMHAGDFAATLTALARSIDYGNFKDAVYRRQGASAYEKALHTVWSVMSRLQPRGPYGGRKNGYPPTPRRESKLRKSPRRPFLGSVRKPW